MGKEELRQKFFNLRDNLENREEKSQKIVEKILQNNNFIQSKNILLYIPVASEVDITSLIEFCFSHQKHVLIPFIDELAYGEIYSFSDLATYMNNPLFKIPKNISTIELDLAIVPGVVFDKERFRLGSGKGWYDRFLSKNPIHSIGVAFKECIVEKLPRDKYDIAVNQLLLD